MAPSTFLSLHSAVYDFSICLDGLVLNSNKS
jgi:hypothetical protein